MSGMLEEVPPTVETEDRACPLGCLSNDELVLMANDRLHGLPGRYPVVRCRGCGLMRTNPRPTAATIDFYYPSNYGPYSSSRIDNDSPSFHRAKGVRRWIREFASAPSNAVPDITPGHMLEFGCASGAFLVEMAQRGWSCEGIEFSTIAATRAAELGFRVQTGLLESADPPLQPCDLVVGWMVLEHLHEPIECLRRLRDWTRRGGWLAVSVPDTGAFDFRIAGPDWYGLHVPNHLYHFDRASIERLLSAAGWKLQAIRWHRNCTTPLLSLRAATKSHGKVRSSAFLDALGSKRTLGPARSVLGVMAGLLRQSGRMTVWARSVD